MLRVWHHVCRYCKNFFLLLLLGTEIERAPPNLPKIPVANTVRTSVRHATEFITLSFDFVGVNEQHEKPFCRGVKQHVETTFYTRRT